MTKTCKLKAIAMITRAVFLIIVFFMSYSSMAFESSGKINLSHADDMTSARNIPLNMDNKLQGEISLYHSVGKGGVYAIRGEFLVDNLSPQKKYYKYRVVLKDKKGVVAQTRGQIHLHAGKNQKIKLSNMVMRQQDARTISSYEVHIDETNR